MAFNLRNRSFVKLLDFTPKEIRFLLELSADLKAAKYGGYEQPTLTGKNVALIFEKSSTRTRTSFEVAAYDQGANVTYLGPSGSQIGHKETMKDTARVLGRTYDGIEYRGFAQATVEILAEYAGVPVWNGLTDEYHPTQILADVLTMTEHTYKNLPAIAYCFMGDAHNNMGNSLMVGGCKLGMDVSLCAPKHLWPEDELVDKWGYPQKSFVAPNGNTVYVYHREDDRRSSYIRNGLGVNVPPEYCTTYFEINSRKIIIKASYKGNICK